MYVVKMLALASSVLAWAGAVGLDSTAVHAQGAAPPPTHAQLFVRYNGYFDQNGIKRNTSADVVVTVWSDPGCTRRVAQVRLQPNGRAVGIRVPIKAGRNQFFTTATFSGRPMRSSSGDPVFRWDFEVYRGNRGWAIRGSHQQAVFNVSLKAQRFWMTGSGVDGVRLVK